MRIDCEIAAIATVDAVAIKSDRDVELEVPVDGGGGVSADLRFVFHRSC